MRIAMLGMLTFEVVYKCMMEAIENVGLKGRA